MPRPGEGSWRLWQQGFSPKAELEQTLDLAGVARDYVLAGGSIMNVIRYVSLQALKEGSSVIASEDVLQGIRREYAKEGKAG